MPADTTPRLTLRHLRNRHVGPLDLELAAGECVCLSGPSGAGKSLLLRAVADLDPHAGEACLDGVPATRMSGPEWRRRVGLLAAESQWWFDRVGDHFNALDPAGLERLGFGPEVAEWEVARLSTGERQRLAVLRLLANAPAVLLLDEPTANLDPAMVEHVEGLLLDYREARGAGLLWVSHDARQAARVADRLLRVEGGRFTEAAA